MITLTQYSVTDADLIQAQNSLPELDSSDKKASVAINRPTGNFFYDPWEIKDEFKNTIWETILKTIPGPFGEARIIRLSNGMCYMSHCDIDDRYHLNLEGQYSFLIDIDSQKMFQTVADGKWYTINAGLRHVAANFGSVNRTQLVVRQLLNDAKLKEPVLVKITPICENPRFEFDDVVSPWLHKMNKMNFLSNFKVLDDGVSFNLEQTQLPDLNLFTADKFKIVISK